MQKKDLQNHMIKLHGAPKPHAVSARLCEAGRARSDAGAVAGPEGGLCGFCPVALPGWPRPPSPWPSLLPLPGPSCPQCPTCDKCFLTRTELQLHEAFKHRGEKLFVCEECGHRASSRNGLQMHIKAKHRCSLARLPPGPVPAAGSGQRVGREGRVWRHTEQRALPRPCSLSGSGASEG